MSDLKYVCNCGKPGTPMGLGIVVCIYCAPQYYKGQKYMYEQQFKDFCALNKTDTGGKDG